MKIIEKTTLIIFSVLMLFISIVICLLAFGWLDIHFVGELIQNIFQHQTYVNILVGISIIFMLLSIRCIFFDSSEKKQEELKNGVLLQNADGKLFITKQTIENLVSNIAKGFESAEEIQTSVEFDRENHLSVLVNMTVRESAIIKELSTNLQTKIKEAVKKSTDLEVKEVNIKVKNVEPVKTSNSQE